MRERLLTEGIDEQKLRVIHNWADGREIRPVAREANVMWTEWALEGKFVVGYSGNLGRAHEIDTLSGAAEKLRDDEEIVCNSRGQCISRRFRRMHRDRRGASSGRHGDVDAVAEQLLRTELRSAHQRVRWSASLGMFSKIAWAISSWPMLLG